MPKIKSVQRRKPQVVMLRIDVVANESDKYLRVSDAQSEARQVAHGYLEDEAYLQPCYFQYYGIKRLSQTEIAVYYELYEYDADGRIFPF